MEAAIVIALSGDTVQLSGTYKVSRVLGWETQPPINVRQLSDTHYAVQPLDAAGHEVGDVVFWPKNAIVVTKRHPVQPTPRIDDFELRF